MFDRNRSIFPFCIFLLYSVAWALLLSGPRSCSAAAISYSDAIKDVFEVFKSDEDAAQRIIRLLAEEKAKTAKEIKDLQDDKVDIAEGEPKETQESLENGIVNPVGNLADLDLEENLNEEVRIKREDNDVKQSSLEANENMTLESEGKPENTRQIDFKKETKTTSFDGDENKVIEAPREVVEIIDENSQPNEEIQKEQAKDINEKENEKILLISDGMTGGNIIVLPKNEQGVETDESIHQGMVQQDNSQKENSQEKNKEIEEITEIGKLLAGNNDSQGLNKQINSAEALAEENFRLKKELFENENEKIREIMRTIEKVRENNEDEMNENERILRDLEIIKKHPEDLILEPKEVSQNINENKDKSEKNEISELKTEDANEQLIKEKSNSTSEPSDLVNDHLIRFNETEEIGLVKNNNSETEEETLASLLEGIKGLSLSENNKREGSEMGEESNNKSDEEEKLDAAMNHGNDITVNKEANGFNKSEENQFNLKPNDEDIHKKSEEDERNNNTQTIKINSSDFRKLLLALKEKNISEGLDHINISNTEFTSRQNNKMINDEPVNLETKEKNDTNKNMSVIDELLDEKKADEVSETEKNVAGEEMEEDGTIKTTEKQLSDLKVENEDSVVADEHKYDAKLSSTETPADSVEKTYVNNVSTEKIPDIGIKNEDSNFQPKEIMLNNKDENMVSIIRSILGSRTNEDNIEERQHISFGNRDQVISTEEPAPEIEINKEDIVRKPETEEDINNIKEDPITNYMETKTQDSLKPEEIPKDLENNVNKMEGMREMINHENGDINLNEMRQSNEEEKKSPEVSLTEESDDTEIKNDETNAQSIDKLISESKSLQNLEADEILSLINNLRKLQESSRKENVDREELEKEILNTIEEANANEAADEVQKKDLVIPIEEASTERNEDLEKHAEKIEELISENIKTESHQNPKEDSNITENIGDAIASTAVEGILNHSTTEPKEVYNSPNNDKGRIVFITSLNALKKSHEEGLQDKSTQENTITEEIAEKSFGDESIAKEETSSEAPTTTQINEVVNSTEQNEIDSNIIRIPVFELLPQNDKTNELETNEIQDNENGSTSETTTLDENSNLSESKEKHDEKKSTEEENLKDNVDSTTASNEEEGRKNLEEEDNTESKENKEGIH